MDKVDIIKADITTLSVDAIVNAANNSLLGGGGVDGAIHCAAGPGLLTACQSLNSCQTGQAKLTLGYELPAKYIIHTVGPIWQGGKNNEHALLASCYHESLLIAAAQKCKSIAFPAISCGVYRFPVDQAVQIALITISEFLKSPSSLEKIFLVCFGEADWSVYNQQLNIQEGSQDEK